MSGKAVGAVGWNMEPRVWVEFGDAELSLRRVRGQWVVFYMGSLVTTSGKGCEPEYVAEGSGKIWGDCQPVHLLLCMQLFP